MIEKGAAVTDYALSHCQSPMAKKPRNSNFRGTGCSAVAAVVQDCTADVPPIIPATQDIT